ncbi:MAG TPA: penicillin-binding protein 1C [Rhizomicrobium sp.]|jgi:penicillin-binding protein 1C
MFTASGIRALVHRSGRLLWRAQNWIAGAALVVIIFAGIRLWPHTPLQNWKPISIAVYDDHGRLLRFVLASDDRYRLWVPLKEMSPQLVDAVLLHEDRWFWWHPGFSPYALVRGAWVTYVHHGNRMGGSTITMQLARLLWPLNTRTPLGKLNQVARAVELELFYPKRQLLEAYLNYAPYGGNIEGAGAASLIYFGKPVRTVSLPEAMALAVIPQNPGRFVRHTQKTGTAINARLTASRDRLYGRWLQGHPEDASLKPLFALPLTMKSVSALPFEAPHAVEQILRTGQVIGEKASPRLATTLDLDLQHHLELQIAQYIARNSDNGIRNTSAILVDTRDMGVKALVGSANYFDKDLHGQVNGTLARRSPGSTLKPFVYALGFDQGVLHPETVLRDVPTAFGPYTPENFDGRFLGPITATEALNRSRNIPAVWISSQLHSPDFYQFLQGAGVGQLASEEHYGLALVLGGGEISMQELATLYAMLANDGMLRPLRFRTNDPQTRGTQLLSAEASFMVMSILGEHVRPDETTGAQPVQSPVYWKTGTSWAFRDAWTAGIFGPYVLIVWVGNFDGSGNPAFVGVDAAAPLFFQIIDAVRDESANLPERVLRPPPGVQRVQICLATGELPNKWCPQTGFTWFIPGKSPIHVSTVHRPVLIDDTTGLAACPPYTGKRVHEEIYEFWPSDLAQVFAEAGIPRRKPPQNPACANAEAWQGTSPQITSPARGSTYALRLAQGSHQPVAFSAVADADSRILYWFVNESYVGRSAPGEALYWQAPNAGDYRVRVVDDHGRSDERPLALTLVN